MARRKSRGEVVQKRWTEDEARAAMTEWKASGKSGAAFARSKGIDPQRLFWWRGRFEGAESKKPMFVPLVATPASSKAASAAALIVTTERGARIEVWDVDAATAAWVVAVLTGETVA